MRTYVLVTSVVPLRAYFYGRGLIRFAGSDYNPKAKGGGDKTQFMTNTSINKGENFLVLFRKFQTINLHITTIPETSKLVSMSVVDHVVSSIQKT